MKCCKFLFSKMVFLALLLLLTSNPGYAVGEGVQSGKIYFRWAFAAISKESNGQKLISLAEKTVLKTGDKFKILVQPQARCFIYLFYRDPQGDINVLFPYDIQLYDKDYAASTRYYVPQSDLWFELDENTGLETFHLLASVKRLIQLENLYRKYKSAPETVSRQKLANEILAEIRKLQRQHRKLTAVAERPVRIGGTLRGTDEKEVASPDVANFAVDISTSDFYSRTFTIDHQ